MSQAEGGVTHTGRRTCGHRGRDSSDVATGPGRRLPPEAWSGEDVCFPRASGGRALLTPFLAQQYPAEKRGLLHGGLHGPHLSEDSVDQTALQAPTWTWSGARGLGLLSLITSTSSLPAVSPSHVLPCSPCMSRTPLLAAPTTPSPLSSGPRTCCP